MDFHDYTFTGGMKLEQNDLLFDQNGVRRAFFGLLSMIVGGDDKGYILSGCERTVSATVDIAAGFFVLNGEIYEVEAHSIPDNGNTEFWQVFEEADPAGNEILEDLSTKDFYIKRRARVAESASPPATFTPSLAPSVFDKLKETEALGIDDLEGEIDVNTLDIVEINDVWTTYNIVLGDLQKTGTAQNLTNIFGAINFKVVGKTLHYNMNIGGDVPSDSKSWDFAGIAAKLGVTLAANAQSNSAIVNTNTGIELFIAEAVWSAAGGLLVQMESGGADISSGTKTGLILSGSIEIG